MPLPSLPSPTRATSVPSLQHRFLVGAGVTGALVLLLLTGGAFLVLESNIERQGNTRVADAANRAVILLNGAIEDRIREAKVLAITPAIVVGAREGAARSRALGIVGADIAQLERRFNDERTLNVAPATRAFLLEVLPQLEVAEILLTDANGYNAVTTERSSDFVQSDEGWWQTAWRDGLSSADAVYDSSAAQTTLSLATLVRDGTAKAGVIKLAFSAAPLVRSLASVGAGVRIDILDSADRILLSSAPASIGRARRRIDMSRGDSAQAFSVTLDGIPERAVVWRANAGRWRIFAHLPAAEIARPFKSARVMLFAGAAALVVVLIILLFAMNHFLQRRITAPATELADAAEAVAAGDFTVQLRHTSADDEIGRLSRAVGAMILELRRLAHAIAGSARETSAMSSEIFAGAEQMAASAGQIANTASDLSSQATSMAGSIASLATSANALQTIAVSLDEGARDGVSRNTTLRTLALENRAGLDASAASLSLLSAEVDASATAIESLGVAGEEIRSFVALVRKLARQSKLLALNAAMEAARAGVHGQGFAVVAAEVRRLATMSSDAADHTEAVVKSVLKGIALSRTSADRAVATAAEVRNATAVATASFAEIEHAVEESEAWTTTIARTSHGTNTLVGEITERLQSLAGGTDSFAAAMEEIAASSQEQSASTQEIAGAANALGVAAEKLSTLLKGLKTED